MTSREYAMTYDSIMNNTVMQAERRKLINELGIFYVILSGNIAFFFPFLTILK
jgi:hypothetical protein